MKKLSIALGLLLISSQSFADVKCLNELRVLENAIQSHTSVVDKATADSLDSANYIKSVAVELMAQPNARVGAYGYNVKKNADVAISNVNFFNGQISKAEDVVRGRAIELENCLINN